jgi:transposase-like protein
MAMTKRRTTEATVEELRAAISATADRRNAGGVPPDVRRRALAHMAEQKSAGIGVRVTAVSLGVHETTLYRWARDARRSDVTFREVVVADRGGPLRAVHGPLRAVHAASGLVIEGLDVETLAALLARLA